MRRQLTLAEICSSRGNVGALPRLLAWHGLGGGKRVGRLVGREFYKVQACAPLRCKRCDAI